MERSPQEYARLIEKLIGIPRVTPEMLRGRSPANVYQSLVKYRNLYEAASNKDVVCTKLLLESPWTSAHDVNYTLSISTETPAIVSALLSDSRVDLSNGEALGNARKKLHYESVALILADERTKAPQKRNATPPSHTDDDFGIACKMVALVFAKCVIMFLACSFVLSILR